MIKKNQKLLIYKSIKYFKNKKCLILDGDNDFKVIKNPYKLDKFTNIFFSINSFNKGNRQFKYLSKFNYFFFDIDKDLNKNKTLEEIKDIIQDYVDYFDIITYTRNGVHCLKEINRDDYMIDGKPNKDKYINEFKNMKNNLEKEMGIIFDPKVVLTSSVARIPGTFHQKKEKGDVDLFQVKIIKGQQLISPSYKVIEEINKINIKDILAILGQTINGISINDTNGYKVYNNKNSIIDFSHDDRLIGEPYFYVYHYMRKKYNYDEIRNLKEIRMKTFQFFNENFGISAKEYTNNKIPIKEIFEKYLENLNGEEILFFISLLNYISGLYNIYFSKKIIIDKKDFILSSKIKFKKDKINSILEFIKNNNYYHEIKLFDLDYNEKEIIINVIPDGIRSNRVFFKTHYLNLSILDLNQKLAKIYLHISNNLLNNKFIYEYQTQIQKITENIKDSNNSRILNNIKGISSITQDFEIKYNKKTGIITFIKN